eukprot:GHUV01033983.1.p1 GENE.GHUV01033983.1~~GHUV01033983.1.p1  ORF type:complete len:127 (-),score=19.22 GHUV01033983.1:625-1005(-)
MQLMRSQLRVQTLKSALLLPRVVSIASQRTQWSCSPHRGFCQSSSSDMASTTETVQPVTAEEARAKAMDMLTFINAAWTPYHAVEEASRRLLSAGYQHIAEKDAWNLKPGQQTYFSWPKFIRADTG